MFEAKQDPDDPRAAGALEPVESNHNGLRREAAGLPAAYVGGEPMGGGGSPFDNIDYMRLLHAIIKRKRMILASVAVCFAVALLITLMSTPIYRAQATIQIEKDTVTVVKVEGFDPSESASDSREFLQTHYELLNSRTLAEHVANNLGLVDEPRFMAASGGGILSTLKGLFSRDDVVEEVDRKLKAVVGTLQDNLVVEPVRNSRLVKIGYEHRDPEMARRIADSFAKTYIADNLERKYGSSSYARTFLEERLQQLKARLEENEKAATDYAQQNDIVNFDDNSSIISANLQMSNANLSKARDDRIRQEMIWKEAENAQGFSLSQVQADPTIQQNRVRRDELAAQYQEKLSLYKPSFPEMVQLKSRIDAFDRSLVEQVKGVKEAVYRDYRAAVSREERLAAETSALEQSLVDLRNRAIGYNILKREADTTKSLYEGLLQRYKEIGVAGGVGVNNITLIDAATLPEKPRTPRVMLNLAIGLAFGLMVGVGTALALEHFDNRFKSPEDLESTLGLPVLGIIPRVSDGGMGGALDDPRSPVAEAYRSLRTSIQFSTSGGTPPTVFVTSTKPAEGKSTTAIALAANFTQLGLKVLLVDADMRKPSVHKKMTLSNEVGLSNYLVGNTTLTEVIQKTDNELLHVMTTGPLPPNPAELLAGAKMVELLSLVSRVFDLVVIDGPPLMGLADAVIMSSQVSATILVAAANDGRREAAVVALRRMRAARAHVIGAVLTKFDANQVGYGYGYGYGYGDYYAYGSDDTKQVEQDKQDKQAPALTS